MVELYARQPASGDVLVEVELKPGAEHLDERAERLLRQVAGADPGRVNRVSLDTPREDGDGEAGTLADAFGQEDERFELVEASVSIGAAARQLSPLERQVLALRFVENQTQTQIAELIGVSQMQVSRILRRAVDRLEDLTQLRNEQLKTP